MTQLFIRQSGGANIVSIPKAILKMLGLQTGASLDLSIEDNKIVLTPTQDQSTLEVLLEGSPRKKLSVCEEDRQWLNGAPVGKEEAS